MSALPPGRPALLALAFVAGLVVPFLVEASSGNESTGGMKDTASPAPAEDRVTVVLVYRERPPVLIPSATPADLVPERTRDAVAAWTWSARTPPTRLAQRELIEGSREKWQRSAPFASEPPLADASALRVRLPQALEGEWNDLRVIAGPSALFREVPEAWIPRWSVSADGVALVPRKPDEPWRLRLVGEGRGGAWLDVAGRDREAVLAPVRALDVELVLADAGGRPVEEGHLTLLEDAHGKVSPDLLSQHLADDQGRVRISSLPADLPMLLVAGAPAQASRTFRGRPLDLPTELRLLRPAEAMGRLVDGDGNPVAGVDLEAEGWLDDEVGVLFRRSAESGEDGTWNLPRLPPRPLVIRAAADGYVPVHHRLEPAEGESVDLGDLVLPRAAVLAVRVRDDAGLPVAGATVSVSGSRPSAPTDDEGRTILRRLAPGPLELSVGAEGHLEAQARILPPWPEEAVVDLERAFTVRGEYLDPAGLPVPSATIRVEAGDSFRFEEPSGDGRFLLHLEPDRPHALRFSSPTSGRRTVDVAAGRPGEVLDLGTVRPPESLRVFGTVVSAVDGTPVSGARLWLPRPSRDPVGTWFHGDLLETRSDELGRFELGGLGGKPEILRVDATGFARAHRPIQPESERGELDLGEIALAVGSAVRVLLPEEPRQRATARLDLRGLWLDLDMLVAPIVDGSAILPHVPAGDSLLTVLSGGELLCEKTVSVEGEGGELEVECDSAAESVTGVVLVSGRPAGPGSLEWRRDEEVAVSPTIFNRTSSLGARQQQVVGRGRPTVRVDVSADGLFTSNHLRPGTWTVTWWPEGGSPAAPRAVEVPEGPAPHVQVQVAGGRVTGRVLDEAGAFAADVRVRELVGGATARTDVDGSFELLGVDPGIARLQARNGDRFSQVAEVWVEEDRSPDPVQLVLSTEHGGRLEVAVLGADGLPGESAFVFLEIPGRSIRVLSADGSGVAQFVVPAPYPERARLAALHAGRWTFGPWTEWQRLRPEAELVLSETGEILVECEEACGALGLLAPGGWDLSRLLSLLGTLPSAAPEQPYLLSGLPEGLYRVDDAHSATVRAGERQRVELD